MLSRSAIFRPLAGAGAVARLSTRGGSSSSSIQTLLLGSVNYHGTRGMASATLPSSSSSSQTPYEDIIRTKLTEAFAPTNLEIYNDSHLHSHHKAMQGSTSKETHFRLYITSDAFRAKMQPARHRMVYTLLKDEMAREGGIHALQLKTRTPEEEERARKLEAEKAAATATATS
jgi:BolA-like protein 1